MTTKSKPYPPSDSMEMTGAGLFGFSRAALSAMLAIWPDDSLVATPLAVIVNNKAIVVISANINTIDVPFMCKLITVH